MDFHPYGWAPGPWELRTLSWNIRSSFLQLRAPVTDNGYGLAGLLNDASIQEFLPARGNVEYRTLDIGLVKQRVRRAEDKSIARFADWDGINGSAEYIGNVKKLLPIAAPEWSSTAILGDLPFALSSPKRHHKHFLVARFCRCVRQPSAIR